MRSPNEKKRKVWNHINYLRRRGIEVSGKAEFLERMPCGYQEGDVLSCVGEWCWENLVWVRREAFYKLKRVDGFHLYQSRGRWYSKKHKGSWRSREEAVAELGGEIVDSFSQINSFAEF